jgi:hypothetical protein
MTLPRFLFFAGVVIGLVGVVTLNFTNDDVRSWIDQVETTWFSWRIRGRPVAPLIGLIVGVALGGALAAAGYLFQRSRQG